MTVKDQTELTAMIKHRAQELGFDAAGVARAGPADPNGYFLGWLEKGFDAEMDYMARSAAERRDPSRLVPGAKSVIALAISYFSDTPRPDTQDAKISRYACFDDYHKVIRKKIRKLRKYILTLAPEAVVHPSVDTSPVLERHWAQEAGIAWIGKSSMAINQKLGTYTFLASLITDLELTPDNKHLDRCGTCTACIDACPPDALVAPYQLDANRCITYWNVEYRKELPEDIPNFEGWIAGCDICQEVCPWNKFAKPTTEKRFAPREELLSPDAVKISQDEEFAHRIIQGTPLQRTGADAMRNNAQHVLNGSSKT